jgi:hypothetical protein
MVRLVNGHMATILYGVMYILFTAHVCAHIINAFRVITLCYYTVNSINDTPTVYIHYVHPNRNYKCLSIPSLEVAFQNGLRLTVDFSREKTWPPYCRLWFQKLTILSTMVLKVDRTVDFQDDFHPTNVDFSKKSPAKADVWPKVDCRLEGLIYTIVTQFLHYNSYYCNYCYTTNTIATLLLFP